MYACLPELLLCSVLYCMLRSLPLFCLSSKSKTSSCLELSKAMTNDVWNPLWLKHATHLQLYCRCTQSVKCLVLIRYYVDLLSKRRQQSEAEQDDPSADQKTFTDIVSEVTNRRDVLSFDLSHFKSKKEVGALSILFSVPSNDDNCCETDDL